MKITSEHIKTALLHYYRYTRQFVCCDEVNSFQRQIADVFVDTGKSYIEIEIKTSKNDLNKEKYKSKHRKNEKNQTLIETSKSVNQYYLCVTEELKDDTLNWIKEINPKYGLILFRSREFKHRIEESGKIYCWEKYLWIIKRATKFHNNYNIKLKEKLIKRLSSAVTRAYTNKIESTFNRY